MTDFVPNQSGADLALETFLACTLLAPLAYLFALITLGVAMHPRGRRRIVWAIGLAVVLGCVCLIGMLQSDLGDLGNTLLAGPALIAIGSMGLSLVVPRRRFPFRGSVKIGDVSHLWARQVQRQQPFVLDERKAA